MKKPTRTAAGDAFSHFSISVIRLAAHLTAAGDMLAKPSGQTSARWQVLAAASHASMSVAEIGRVLGLARQGVQRIADLLEKEGLVRYEENPAHQRAKLLMLTLEGETVLRDIQIRQASWADSLGAAVNAQDLRLTTETLTRLLEQLSAPKPLGG
ncbi:MULTISPECIES: MarR family winged helix-turn-helix transcriptional regulator [unclassified Rhizobium]|uniref:MarR family winged helix-turn-helix transcriptional regulator n=1 Tax=unclassified Rhizobium TaxID=2613769 RepID=UPI0007135EC4|nr:MULTISPECIES: helix-turn-helix domain-containing protein [unclassified Rhizobium]KQS89680.1 MarR family transcriptional regulator [Rhizobium sp. Leaf391]KQS94960.1 MarR family transcriptional regulator [Rhizobium sp. Leaf386]KQU01336.1 MarR family transcriptional regulator [Rhizobium sp. Leaf453]